MAIERIVDTSSHADDSEEQRIEVNAAATAALRSMWGKSA